MSQNAWCACPRAAQWDKACLPSIRPESAARIFRAVRTPIIAALLVFALGASLIFAGGNVFPLVIGEWLAPVGLQTGDGDDGVREAVVRAEARQILLELAQPVDHPHVIP
jgi:hypothetical protein